MKKVIEFMHVTGVEDKDCHPLYAVGDIKTGHYSIDAGGYVNWFLTREEAENRLDDPIAKPFDDCTDLDVFEVDGKMAAVFDANLNNISDYVGLEDILYAVDNGDYIKSKFVNFSFPEDWDDEDGDYSDHDYYDRGPSYYDPRYDGPMHYIPPGER